MTSLTYPLTITEADLDAAMARRGQPNYLTCEHCLFAHALRRQEGEIVRIGYRFKIDGTQFSTFGHDPARQMIRRYDLHDYDEVRAQLPITFYLPSES